MLASIASANFDAVSLLRIHRSEDAIGLFRVAMGQIARCIEESDDVAVEANNEQQSAPAMIDATFFQFFPVPVLSDEELATVQGKQPFDDMYAKAFVFANHQASAITTATAPVMSDRLNMELTVVTMYNLGLAMHMTGLRTGRTAMISKACQLYLRAYGILMSRDLARSDPLISLVLTCAVNMASAYTHLLDIQSTRHWRGLFLHVYNWACFATATTEQDTGAAIAQDQAFVAIHPEDSRFFALCAILFRNTKLLSTAPAA